LLDVTLTARLGSRVLGESWQFVVNPPASSTPYVNLSERAASPYSVRFELDPAWLTQAGRSGADFSLEANVSIAPGIEGLLSQCQGLEEARCLANDRFRLDGLPVRDDLPVVTVKTLALLRSGQGVAPPGYVLQPPEDVFRRVRQMYPGGERLKILPYKEVLNIDPVTLLNSRSPFCQRWPAGEDRVRFCRMGYVAEAVNNWRARSRANRIGYDILAAIHHYPMDLPPDNYLEPGWTNGELRRGRVTPIIFVNHGKTTAGAVYRPLTAGAHEFGHAMRAPHADTVSPDPVTGRPCGGQKKSAGGAEPWPADNTGRLQSTAFDLGTLRVDWPDNRAPLFDLMSYCAGERDSWISAFNWTRAYDTMKAFGAVTAASRLSAAHARTGQAFVSGVLGPDGATIVQVVPADPLNEVPEPDPASPIQVRALDSGGRQLAVVGATIETSSEASAVRTFIAGLPAGTAAVEVVSAGQVLDHKARSRPPSLRVVAPRNGARVGGGSRSRLVVRWRATDPDNDPLGATVEFSANGRSGWRPVFTGSSTGSATVPGRFLERSDRARVRVRINDGFSEAIARSGRFRAEGAPPTARLIAPAGSHLPAPGLTELRGAGLDDRNLSLRGRALTWFVGQRRVGQGERVQVRLPAGRVVLRLRARDRFGRVSTATRPVTVAPVQLQLRSLAAPEHVAAKARTIKVKVTTSTAAILRAGGRKFAVGPHARTMSIPLPRRPVTGILKVSLSLTARGVRQRVLHDRITVLRS
jgi:hypothetical protein